MTQLLQQSVAGWAMLFERRSKTRDALQTFNGLQWLPTFATRTQTNSIQVSTAMPTKMKGILYIYICYANDIVKLTRLPRHCIMPPLSDLEVERSCARQGSPCISNPGSVNDGFKIEYFRPSIHPVLGNQCRERRRDIMDVQG